MVATAYGERSFGAFLFDMDGTIINSVAAAERIWAAWALRHGLDVEAFLPTIHGVRAIETIRRLALPGVSPEAEAAFLTEAELADVDGVQPIEGAAEFLASLPPDRWAIVTSAPRALLERRMAAAGLPMPKVVVTAEEVQRGKPAPDCFLLAAQRLGVPIADCLVFEDAPAGIQAAVAAGASVAVVTAAHRHPVETAHPSLESYATLAVVPEAAAGIRLRRAG
jgi:mannitol-1-/sugar-/sorbitol-6-phosphatase